MPKRIWLTFLQLEHCVFYLATTCSQSVAFKVDELNQFSYATNQDRYRWDEIILWVHKTTLTTKSEQPLTERSPGRQIFSKDNVRYMNSSIYLKKLLSLKLMIL
jgi:hypothetical protein